MANPKPLRNLTFNLSLGAAALAMACALLVVAAQPAQAQTYDAAADFEQGFINQTNPNGVWSYGWSSSFTTPITLYDQTAQPGINGPNAQYWISSSINYGESPSAEFNDGQAYDDGNIDFLPYEFLLVSGIAGQYSNLVFTAPTSGIYSVTGSFRGCQYGIGVVVGIVVNGNVIFNSTVSSEGQVVPFDTNLSLAAGDTVIFSVGPNGGLQNTGLAATITKQTGTYTVLHNFTGEQDGGTPYAGLTLDNGNLYGTAYSGGASNAGTVYKLQHKGSGWTFSPLYTFTGNGDGANPAARVIVGPDGTLYGTTLNGGTSNDGTVFNLRPFPTACKTALCPWMETVLFSFNRTNEDAANPDGDLVFDGARNIYGTTSSGGYNGDGVVYQLTSSGVETVLHRFVSGDDGAIPYGGVILDSGNLYGTTFVGGQGGLGTVYELTPMHGGWTESIIASFQDDGNGDKPHAGLIADDAGNLYGSTVEVEGSGGTVFELTPSNGGWTLNTIYPFSGIVNQQCGPWAKLFMDKAGNLYGTTLCDGAYGHGNVFELSPTGTGWIYNDLYDFSGGSDGGNPISNVVMTPTVISTAPPPLGACRGAAVWARCRLGDHAVTEAL